MALLTLQGPSVLQCFKSPTDKCSLFHEHGTCSAWMFMGIHMSCHGLVTPELIEMAFWGGGEASREVAL